MNRNPQFNEAPIINSELTQKGGVVFCSVHEENDKSL